MTTATKPPPFWQRLNPFSRPAVDDGRRAIDLYGGERTDLLEEAISTP